MNKFVGKIGIVEVLVWIFLILVLFFTVTPIVFMFTSSFMDARQILAMPYHWIPSSDYFSSADRTFFTNFQKAILGNNDNPTFFRNMFNSFVVAIVDSVTTVLLASLCGYGLAKFKFKGRNIVFLSIMATMMIPFEAFPFMVSAFGVFQMRQYLLTFPSEYLDAARVDGLSEPKIYSRIVLPNCKPVIATLGILSFRNQWDNLLWPLLVAQREAMKTLPQYITQFSEEKMTDEGAMMACALLASIPMIILFFALSKYFLGGAAVYESRKG